MILLSRASLCNACVSLYDCVSLYELIRSAYTSSLYEPNALLGALYSYDCFSNPTSYERLRVVSQLE